jgi:hypothetical protein
MTTPAWAYSSNATPLLILEPVEEARERDKARSSRHSLRSHERPSVQLWRKMALARSACSKMRYGQNQIRHDRTRVSALGVRPPHAQERRSDNDPCHKCGDRDVGFGDAQHGAKCPDDRRRRMRRFSEKVRSLCRLEGPGRPEDHVQGTARPDAKGGSDAAKAPGAKATLEGTCKQSADQMKASMSAFGCSF